MVFNRRFLTVLMAGSFSLVGGLALAQSPLPTIASDISPILEPDLFYTYNGERIYLQQRQDAIAVAFKPAANTRGEMQPQYLQLQRALRSSTREIGNGVVVNSLGEGFAIIRFPATRGISKAVVQQAQQQPYVQETLPVLSRDDRAETIILPNEIILSFEPGVSNTEKQTILQQNKLEVIRPLRFNRDRVLVRSTAVSGVEVLGVANRLHRVKGVRSASPNFIQSLSDLQLKDTSKQTTSSNLQSFVWDDRPQASSRAIAPQASYLNLQWNLYSPPLKQCLTANAPLQQCLKTARITTATSPRPDLRVTEAWKLSNGGKGVVVAVVDSVIQWDHPNLRQSLYAVTSPDKCPNEIYGWDFTSNPSRRTTDPCSIGDSDTRLSETELATLAPRFRNTFQLSDTELIQAYPDQANGIEQKNPGLSTTEIATRIRASIRMEVAGEFHGTWVSGVVAAQPQAGKGIVGVAPNAKILPVRVMGLQGQFIPSIYLEGLAYAVDRRADVINISLGGRLPSEGEEELIADLLKQNPNLVIVAAAGNEATAQVGFPAGLPGVVAVGATNLSGNRAPYSNFGQGLTLVAPGGDVSSDSVGGIPTVGGTWLATFWRGIPTPPRPWSFVLDPKGEYWWVQGTSFSSPAVAGVVALMRGEDPGRQLNRDQLISMLKSSASYGGLTISKEEAEIYKQQRQSQQPSTPSSSQQYFFGSGLVNAEAAIREVKRSLK